MSDYDLPSQFVEDAQNEENFDHLLDLELFGEDQSGAVVEGEQALNHDDSPNQQDVAPSGTPGVQDQQQEVSSNADVLPPLNFDDFVEPQDSVLDPENGIADNEALGGVSVQAGLPDLEYQPQSGAADPSGTGLQTNGQINLEQLPQFDFDVLNSQEWRDYANTGADLDIDDILGTAVREEQQSQDHEQEGHNYGQENLGQDIGTSSYQVEPLTASRQGSHVNTPGVDSGYSTAAMSRESTHGLSPATPHQNNNAVRRPAETSRATTTAARHRLAEEYADTDDEYESSSVSDEVEYETYEENDPLIVEDPPKEKWGRTGLRNGQEVWFNPETHQWQPSASHHDMRATLIARAQAEYPTDRYLHPDPTDGISHGETAFFKPHQNRGPNRNQCADELFVWREYQSKKDENGKPLRKSKPKSSIDDHPGFMFEEDKILLDPRNNPVVNHKFIPLTLAVHTDGGKLQEMALKPGCRQVDLWARMPRYEKEKDKFGKSTMVPLKDKNTRINMPMLRFREKKGTIAGSDREGTDVIMAGLRRFYHHHGFDPVAAGNSVKTFERDLEPWEVKQVRLGNVSQFGGRAGHRALDDATRESNRQKTLKAIENGKKRQAAKNGSGAGKRSREDDADSQGSSVGPPKRRRRGQEVDPGLAAFDEGYIGQQAAPTFENGQNGYGLQPSLYQQQRGYAQAMGPPQVQYSAYGPSSFPTPAPRRTQQHQYGGVDMQATRSPYVNAQAPAPLNNSLLNSQYYPEDQYPRFNTGVQSFGPRGPQQASRFTMAPNPRMSAEVQRQRHAENPYSVPRPAGNTLAPGGRRDQQAPQQVLGKRRQRDAPEFGVEDGGTTNTERGATSTLDGSYGPMDPTIPRLTGREHLNGQANLDLDFGSAHKRRRNNENPGTEPRQQRHHRPERTPRLGHYGAGGAPTPSLPPGEVFGSAQRGSNPLGNAEGQLQSPGTIARELGDIFGEPHPTPTQTADVDQGTNVPRRHEPRQVLGKHRREDSMGRWGEDMFGQQDPGDNFGSLREDVQEPGPKRRRLPGTGGYPAPPIQAPTAQQVRKARRREQDAQPPPLELNTDGPLLNSQQTPQVLGAVSVPPQNIYTTNTPARAGAPTQVFDSLGANPPQPSVLPQAYSQAPTDIRDLRPSNGDESQSLDSALRYTRDAFREWTGLEAPVTNLEDSYNVQYREIRSAFRAWWRSEENPHRGDLLPELWRASRWSGGMDDWDAPEDGEHLREARRSGKRAA